MDGDGNVVIIELKDGCSGRDPQVLRYAIRAETDPDAIKSWLESPQKPNDRIIDWDALKVRIMVIAEKVPVNVLQLGNRIAYSVNLLRCLVSSRKATSSFWLHHRHPKKSLA